MKTDMEQLRELVDAAMRATEEVKDIDLRRSAFDKVLDHLLKNGDDEESPATGAASASRPGATGTHAADDADHVFADEQQRVDAVARYFKIEPEEVGHIFDVSSEEPRLVIPSGTLDNRKSTATQEICLLIAGARTALGQETATSDIRLVADDYGKLDEGNFMATLGAMPAISVLGKPRSHNRVIRMRALGAEASQVLARRLLGE